MVDECPLQRQQ